MRVVRGLAAALLLVLAVVGTPLLLLRVGRLPVLSEVVVGDPLTWLLSPDDGTVLFALLTVVAWLAWVVFTVCVVVELVSAATRWRVRIRLPGLRFPQAVAAGLVLAAVSLVVAPVRAGAAPEPPPPAPIVQVHQPGAAIGGPAGAPTGSPVRPADSRTPAVPAVHTVTAGDDLWSLAERYYGDGSQWRMIASANAERLARHGPDDLTVGWQLVVPPAGDTGPGRWVVAAPGESLSLLAERHLGAADRWDEIYALNRGVMSDPDELAVGTALLLPVATATDRAPASDTTPAERPAPEQPPVAEQRPGAADPDGSEGSGGGPRPGPGDVDRPEGDPAPPDGNGGGRGSVDQVPSSQDTDGQDADGQDADGQDADGQDAGDDVDPALLAAGIGGMLAAALTAGLAGRRAWQLAHRPVGRRISHPTVSAQRIERALGRQQDPVSLALVDRALRLVSGWCRDTGARPPRLLSARLGPARLDLELATVTHTAPEPFVVNGRVWSIEQPAVWAGTTDPYPEGSVAWPALTTLGSAGADHLLLNLEETGVLGVDGDAEDVTATLTAIAMELAFCRWSTGVRVTVIPAEDTVDIAVGWIEALDAVDVVRADNVDLVIDRFDARAAAQRAHLDGGHFGALRLDPDTAEPWAAEVLVVDRELTAAQDARLQRIIRDSGAVTMAAVVAGTAGGGATVLVDGDRARLRPGGAFTVQRIPAELRAALTGLLTGTAGATTPAPWWHTSTPVSPGSATSAREVSLGGRPDSEEIPVTDDRPVPGNAPRHALPVAEPVAVDNVTVIRPRRALPASVDPPQEVSYVPPAPLPLPGGDHAHVEPVVRLLGTIDIVGARGVEPARSRRQCIEYCAWLLEHPGRSATAMAAGLVIADGTRRSNMSRLRAWLGEGPDGAYLPDAYSGRISLADGVTSDWQRLQLLVTGGVNRASTPALGAALELVRGAPLADAAPGQWHWAEELRTDMVSAIRDIGVELCDRALADGDVDLARWAAARALVAAAGDERLLLARVRTEHRAGNAAEVQRLALQLTAQARRLGIDLEDETVSALQQIIEGSVRPRHAP